MGQDAFDFSVPAVDPQTVSPTGRALPPIAAGHALSVGSVLVTVGLAHIVVAVATTWLVYEIGRRVIAATVTVTGSSG